MPNQTTRTPGPGDVADERGHFAPATLPGEPPIVPDGGTDEADAEGSSGSTPSTPRTDTRDQDLADPDADANG